MRTDVTFAIQQVGMSERRACKLVNLDRSSYRYEPAPDHNTQLRQELVDLARQKPRYGYRRLHALLTMAGSPAWIRTTIHGSKGRCPTIRRPGNEGGKGRADSEIVAFVRRL